VSRVRIQIMLNACRTRSIIER